MQILRSKRLFLSKIRILIAANSSINVINLQKQKTGFVENRRWLAPNHDGETDGILQV